ncbi:MAG: hypothetical protein J6R29_01505 [Clostridia bacterium]|nr:hypothetical protein [Clostridia bacterium]
MGIPTVIIRGILESGKTTVIEESLLNGDFGDVGRTLILLQEEGEVEFNKDALKKCKASVKVMSKISEWNDKYINEVIREFRPQVVFIEVNEMWDFNSLKLPSYLDVQQVMSIIDGSTFNVYFNAMRQKFVDMIKTTEIAIINRCKPTEETSNMKRSLKIINSNMTVIALDENGKELKLETDLPFSLKNDPITLKLSDFGAFYIDSFENKDRYDGKVIEFDCMAVFDRKLPPKSFVAGRLAMTCCVDDIQLIGHLCAYDGDLKLKNKSWIHLKAVVHYMTFKGSKESQVVFEALEINEIKAPSEEDGLVTLN